MSAKKPTAQEKFYASTGKKKGIDKLKEMVMKEMPKPKKKGKKK